jgi:hypothetical protein
LQRYVESGLLVPLPTGDSARFRIEKATEGAPIAKAFEIAGAIGAIANELWSAVCSMGLQERSMTSRKRLLVKHTTPVVSDMPVEPRISPAIFEAAGDDLYRKLRAIWNRFGENPRSFG